MYLFSKFWTLSQGSFISPMFPFICNEGDIASIFKIGFNILAFFAFSCYVLTPIWLYYSPSEHIYSCLVAICAFVAKGHSIRLRFSSICPYIDVPNWFVPYTNGRCMPYINEIGIVLCNENWCYNQAYFTDVKSFRLPIFIYRCGQNISLPYG